jgi:hypothetical protein
LAYFQDCHSINLIDPGETMQQQIRQELEQLLPEHNRLIPRLDPELAKYSAVLPSSWLPALQDPGDPGQSAALIWHPLLTIARGFIFRLENITVDLKLVVSEDGRLPPYLLYICEYGHSLHTWLAGSPASEDELRDYEQHLRTNLPGSYRAFLKIHNGFITTDRPELGFLPLKQLQLISFTDMDLPGGPTLNLLSFSEDRVGQMHAFDLNAPNGNRDFLTGVWDAGKLSLGELKSFWSYLKDFSIHSFK